MVEVPLTFDQCCEVGNQPSVIPIGQGQRSSSRVCNGSRRDRVGNRDGIGVYRLRVLYGSGRDGVGDRDGISVNSMVRTRDGGLRDRVGDGDRSSVNGVGEDDYRVRDARLRHRVGDRDGASIHGVVDGNPALMRDAWLRDRVGHGDIGSASTA